MGLERGPLSLVRSIEEVLEERVAASVQKTEINGLGDPLRWPRDTALRKKLALTSPTGGGRSVGIVRSRAKATEEVQILSETFLILRRTERDMITNVYRAACKVTVIVVRFL